MRYTRLQITIIVFFSILKFSIPFWLINPSFELHRDEYLYLADAQHLSWGYIEMPPLLASLGWLSNYFGLTKQVVYIWPSLFGTATIVITAAIAKKLSNNTYAIAIACLCVICSGFLRMHILFQPNFLDVFFWSFSSYCLIAINETNNKKYLYWLGISFGLGMLSKYTMVFFIVACIPVLTCTSLRKWLTNRSLYLALLLAFLIWLPNLIWQIQHKFPVLHHMQLLKENQLDNSSRIEFLLAQILMTLPCFFVWLIGLYFTAMHPKGRKNLFVLILYVGIIVLFLWQKGKGYYAAGIYPLLLAIGSVAITEYFKSNYIKVMIPIIMIGTTWYLLPILIPNDSPVQLGEKFSGNKVNEAFLRWEDGQIHTLPQDYADMLGWEAIAQKTSQQYLKLPIALKKDCIVFADNYGQAGALLFYSKKYPLPPIYSDEASFVFWLPNSFHTKNVLLVAHTPRSVNDKVFKHFERITILDSLNNPLARENGVKIIGYFNAKDSFEIAAKNAIQMLKNQYNLPLK